MKDRFPTGSTVETRPVEITQSLQRLYAARKGELPLEPHPTPGDEVCSAGGRVDVGTA